MLRTDKRLRLCAVLLICNLLFIWGNSMLPAEVSRAFSTWVRSLLDVFLGSPEGSGIASGDGLLRKVAHFTEFACLGLLLSWLFGMLQKKGVCALYCGAAAACIDETIQIFVPERGPGIKDVCLDTCGVLFGMFLLYVGHTYYVQNMKKPMEEQ